MTIDHSFGLRKEIVESLKAIFEKQDGIEKVIVYGSRAKGNYKPGSDIDITVIGKTLTSSDLLQIENQIDDLMLPYKVDLSLFHQIENSDLIEHIQRVGLELYSSHR